MTLTIELTDDRLANVAKLRDALNDVDQRIKAATPKKARKVKTEAGTGPLVDPTTLKEGDLIKVTGAAGTFTFKAIDDKGQVSAHGGQKGYEKWRTFVGKDIRLAKSK